MKKLLITTMIILMGCAGIQGRLERTAGPPTPPPPPIGTAAELSAGTVTAARTWAPKTLADTYSGASAEVVDAAVGAAGNGDTNHAYSKDDIHDYVAQHDSDYDGLPDGVEASAIVDAMLGLSTPALGTPSSVILNNGTGLPISTGVSGLGTNVATALSVNIGAAGAPVLFNGAGGTPSAITLTNGTGLPIATGLTGSLANLNTVLSVTLLDDGDIAGSTAIGLNNGGTYTNFGAASDDSLNEMFAAIDAAWPGGGNNTAYNSIADPTGNGSISFGAYTGNYTSDTDGWGGLTIETTVANNVSTTNLLTLQSADANDTNISYLRIIEDSDGTPVTLFEFKGRTLTLGSGASIEGLGSLSLGGLVFGDTTPDADGEEGYASNTFLWFANSEDWKITASTNMWTFDSNTGAAFTFTPAVTLTGGITSIGAASNLSGATVTLGTIAGTIDGGGATSFEIPNGANPTTDAAGEIAVDSSAGAGQGIRGYAAAAFTLPAWQTKCTTIAGATASSDYMVEQLPFAVTIQQARVTQRGATNVVGHFDECDSAGASCAGIDGATDITATTTATDDGSLSNPTIDANDVIQWHTTSVSGTNTDTIVCIYYTVDQVN